jgi:hypothetical protein
MGGVYLVIITAARTNVMLNWIEILACICCLIGAFELVIPQKVEYILFCGCLRTKKQIPFENQKISNIALKTVHDEKLLDECID